LETDLAHVQQVRAYVKGRGKMTKHRE
jgi:hypothetical protein